MNLHPLVALSSVFGFCITQCSSVTYVRLFMTAEAADSAATSFLRNCSSHDTKCLLYTRIPASNILSSGLQGHLFSISGSMLT